MSPIAAEAGRPPWAAIALLSGSALAYEVLLMRLLSIVQWHHFAYMIISLALLGYGASGTFLSLAQGRLLARYTPAFVSSVVLFALSSVGCFLLAQRIGFNAEEVLWDPRQPLRLFGIYLLLTVPFFFAALGVALSLARYRERIALIYAFDMSGAGLGGLGIVLLLFVLFPSPALAAIGVIGLFAAAVAVWELRMRRRRALTLALAVAAALLVLPFARSLSWTQLSMSPYKSLSQTLRITGSEVVAQRSSPLGLLTVVANPVIPLREAPGLSINARSEPPPQLGVFTDGDAVSAITRDSGDRTRLAYLDQTTSALPYHLIRPQHVLVLGAGGGSDVLQARYHEVPHIDAVELNSQLVDLVRRQYGEFSGHVFASPDVRLHIGDARGFVAGSDTRFDLIQMALLDSFGASAAGLYALSENYLYTVEAMRLYLRHLRPSGYLALTRWIKLPPRDTLKLFATATAALESMGIGDPGQRLILIRGWQTSTLLIKNGVVSTAEIRALRAFCASRAFDVAYYPGMPATEANRYNVLPAPYFYRAAQALLGPAREAFLADYKFDLRPATDDRPYFFHFLKLRALPELFRVQERGGMPLLEWGYLVLVATLVQAALASLVLIALPLLLRRRAMRREPTAASRSRTLIYFLAIGLAFLFIEIAFLQKFILFLHHPLYAAAAVLAAFLIFAGLGSAWSRRLAIRDRPRRAVAFAVAAIALLGLLYGTTLGMWFDLLSASALVWKLPLTVTLIAPLAFAMGIPFPTALARLAVIAPEQVPWAWAVNGCASVLSAVLATLLAIHLGFNAVVALAVGCYAVALASFPAPGVVTRP